MYIYIFFEEKAIIQIHEDFPCSMPITLTTDLLSDFLPGNLGLKVYVGPQASLGSPPYSNSWAMLLSCLTISEECC